MSAPIRIGVIGLGASGLALIRALARSRAEVEVVALEARATIPRDRVWSSWFGHSEAADLGLEATWPAWRVCGPDDPSVRRARGLVYGSVHADTFARATLDAIADDPRFIVHFDLEAGPVRRHGEELEVDTADGGLEADVVFDSRARALRPARGDDVTLWQRFEGWEIQADRACFDPGTVTLMDFRVEPGEGVHFVYLLPFAPDRALVEDTWFVGDRSTEIAHDRHLRSYLAEHVDLARFDVLRTERGTLAMSTRDPEPSTVEGHVPIGVAAGWMRPSTGYSFRSALRRGEALAGMIARGRTDDVQFRWPRSVRALDRIFLRFLQDRPELAPMAFERLFGRVDPRTLVGFLDGDADAHALREVVAALPAPPLMAAGLRSARGLVS